VAGVETSEPPVVCVDVWYDPVRRCVVARRARWRGNAYSNAGFIADCGTCRLLPRLEAGMDSLAVLPRLRSLRPPVWPQGRRRRRDLVVVNSP